MMTFLALAHMLDATQVVWGGGGDDNVPCTCTHVGCCTCPHVGCYTNGLGWGGMITFLALAHMLDATQVVWGGGGMITFLALAHMLDATQMVWGGGGDNVSRRTLSHLVNKK